MGVGQAHVPGEAAMHRVAAHTKDVLIQDGNGEQAAPADEILAAHPVAVPYAGVGVFGAVVLPQGAGGLEDLRGVGHAGAGDLMGHGVVMVGGQTSQHHVVGGRPDGAAPVTALGIVVGAVGGHGGYAVGTLEFFLVVQVGDETRHPLRGDDLRQQRPIGCNGHHAAALAVAPFVIVEGILLRPEALVDDLCQVVDFRLQRGDVLLVPFKINCVSAAAAITSAIVISLISGVTSPPSSPSLPSPESPLPP